jgi:hypothetical protein
MSEVENTEPEGDPPAEYVVVELPEGCVLEAIGEI